MKNNFWKNKKVVLTGGSGFLGKVLTKKLEKLGINPVIPRSKTDDLRKREVCEKIVKGADIIIHAAGNVGGIGYNREHPGTLFLII